MAPVASYTTFSRQKNEDKTVIPRILVIYEKQHVRERNPLALQVNYESLS